MKTLCQINLFLKFPGCQLHSELFHFVCVSEPLVWRLLKSFLIVTGWGGDAGYSQSETKCLPCGESAPSDVAALKSTSSGCCHCPVGEVKGFGALFCSRAGGTVPKEAGRSFQQGLEQGPVSCSRVQSWETRPGGTSSWCG